MKYKFVWRGNPHDRNRIYLIALPVNYSTGSDNDSFSECPDVVSNYWGGCVIDSLGCNLPTKYGCAVRMRIGDIERGDPNYALEIEGAENDYVTSVALAYERYAGANRNWYAMNKRSECIAKAFVLSIADITYCAA
jgi:hypothetical protein